MVSTTLPGHYTTDEAARRLKIAPALVCRYCQLGRLKAHKVGSQWLIPHAALDAFARMPRPVGNPNFRR